MNISQRLNVLERRTATAEPTGIPIKPFEWTDGEHMAVIKGLGLMGANIMTLTDVFMDKYQTYIEQIRAEYNDKGITPDKPIIKAEPITFIDVMKRDRARYGL